MRIAFVYGPFCLGGSDTSGDHVSGFDFANMWKDARGLTGSELSFFRIAQESRKLGHDVHVYTFGRPSVPAIWEGLRVHPFSELVVDSHVPGSFDAVCSWNEAEVLRLVPGGKDGPVRMCNLQINDFVHCRPGFGDIVDVWTSPSDSHRKMVFSKPAHPVHLRPGEAGYVYVPDPSRWEVLTNGCDPGHYDILLEQHGVEKVPGRVIWGSSPDRGLHWLLQEWPKIKRAAPHAHLKIFYRVMKWADNIIAHPYGDPTIMEQIRRARYIKEALRRLSSHGVELVDSVSRNQIDREMAEAQVLAYSCDPVSWTEGFSVTLMEGCAARSCPVSTSVDALPEIYGGHIPLIPLPVSEHMSEFSDAVIRGLTDQAFRDDVNMKARALSLEYMWTSLARRLESILTKAIARKKTGV